MEQEPKDKQSGRAAAIAALLGASAGAGIGWIIWLATGNNAVAIGMAGPIALLTNNLPESHKMTGISVAPLILHRHRTRCCTWPAGLER